MNKNYAILNHIKELEYRMIYIIISFILCFLTLYYFINETTYLCVKPLIINQNIQIDNLIFTDLSEAFICTLKLTFILTNYTIFNIILYHIYYFIIPGTYRYEQKKILRIFSFSLMSVYLSLILTYYIFIPIFWSFFLSQHITIDSEIFRIDYQGKIIEYITLLSRILFGFILSFQLPLIFTTLLYQNIISVSTLTKYRSMNIVFCFICGAIFSPPDVISQISLALPLCCLYEANIIFGIFLSKKKYLAQN